MRYLYGITDAPKGISIDRRGLGDEPAVVLHYREIGAVVGPADGPGYRAEPGNLEAHEEVIEAVMERYTILPARFSTVLSGEDAILAVLEEHYDQFRSDLLRLRGKLELGVKALWRPGASPGPARCMVGDPGKPQNDVLWDAGEALAPGKEYLVKRIQEVKKERLRFQEAEAITREIHRVLSESAADTRLSILPAPGILFSGAYLVERSGVLLFEELLEKLKGKTPEIIFLFSGPWPPYNFVSPIAR